MIRKPICFNQIPRLVLSLMLLAGMLLPFVSEVSAAPVSRPVQAVSNAPAAAGSTTPVLLVYNDNYTSNVFGHFLGEIMKAEGFNLFDTVQLSGVNSTLLSNYDTVVLAETSLNNGQANTFNQYVSNGGNLIAMRPDSRLANTLGLTSLGSTIANGYMAIQTGNNYGQGFQPDSLQLHTTADRYTLGTAQTVALLYSDASTATSFPAVTVNSFGSGKAAAFTYDLAQSVVYTRQGNPNQLDTDADGDGIIRIVDMYYNWINLNKMPLPQADIQQRLFGRILSQLNSAKKPLPRFWYFPNAKNTTVILTSDAHGNPDSYFANMVSSMGQFNVTTSFYMAQAGQPTPADVANWQNLGFDFSTHPYKIDTPLSTGYDDVDTWFDDNYGPRTSRTVRVHRLQWQGWVDGGKIGEARGYNMDFTYYRYGNWLLKPDNTWARGYMTGSSLPMKMIDQSGQIVDNFGQYTEIADDQMLYTGPENLSDSTAFVYTKQAIDASEAGDNQAIAMQMHVDYYAGEQTWAENTISYTKNLGIPMFNGDTWLGFTENRYNSTLSNVTWANNKLSFTASVPATQTGQTLMLPKRSATGNLTTITVNGLNKTFTSQTVRGEDFAFVVLGAGSSTVQVTYVPDVTPPTISNISVLPSTTQAQISWTTNEQATSVVNYGTSAALGSTASVAGYATSHTVTLTGLTPGLTYYYKVTSADQAGNSASSTTATFSTPSGQLVHNTFAQFAAGTFTNTAATGYLAGEVSLLSPLEDTFPGTALDSTKWNSGTWVGGGSTVVSGSQVTVSGAYLTSKTSIAPAGYSLSFQAKFTPGVANQHIGLSPDLSSSWFLFSVPGFDSNNLYARTNFNGTGSDQQVVLAGFDMTQLHTYQIEFVTGKVNYYVDGTLVANQNVTVSGSMPVWVSSASTAGPIKLEWLRFNNYPASGTFVSIPMDAGTAVSWAGLSWAGALNGGGVQIETRSSGDQQNWTAWSTPNSATYQAVTSSVGRYIQYRLTLTSPSPASTPQVTAITVGYNAVAVDHVTVTPASANVGQGQTLQFTATGYDATNQPLPGLLMTWAVVNGGGTINAASGVFTGGTTSGTFTNTIKATGGGKNGFASVTIGNPPPLISSYSPISFTNASNVTLTITGTNFLATPAVQLGAQALSGVTLTGSTKLTAIVPAGFTPGAYNLTVINPGGVSSSGTFTVTVTLPPPALTGVSPASGTNAVNNTITLNGSSFVAGATVKLGTTSLATVNFVSAAQLTAVVPAGFATGLYDVTVTNPDGQSATLANSYTVLPPAPPVSLRQVSPGVVSNTVSNTLTILGANFSGTVTVALNNVNQAGATLVDASTITLPLPAGFATGTYDLKVTNGDSQTAQLPQVLTVLPQAIIQDIPSNFATGTFSGTTTLNRLNGEIKLKTSLEDYFETGTLDNTKWTSAAWGTGGTATQAGGELSLKTAYVRSLNTVPVDRLQGRLKFSSNSSYQHFGFSDDLSTTWILFSVPGYDNTHIYARTNINGVNVDTPLNVTLDTYHDFVIVVGGGTVNYYVDGSLLVSNTVNAGGNSYVWLSASSATNPLVADSVKVGYYPASGSYISAPLDAGQLVTWNSLYWQAANTATATLQARTSVDGVTWSAWSAATNAPGNVPLTLPGGRYLQYQLNLSTADNTQSPEVQAVAGLYSSYVPGPVARIAITPTGANLISGQTQQFSAQGYDSNNVALSGLTFTWSTTGGGTISAVGLYTAGATGGSYPNSVIAASGTITASASVTITALAPTVSGVNPTSGSALTNNTITISGANFQAGATVKLGNITLGSVNFVSASQLTAVVAAGTAAGTYNLTVTNPDNQSATLNNAYTVTAAAPPPTIRWITPSVISNSVANTITIVGANFAGPVTVALSGTPQSGVTLVDANTITLALPAASNKGTFNLTVTNADGQSATLNQILTVLPQSLIQDSAANFATGTFTNTLVTNRLGGEVKLNAGLEDYFESGTLDNTTWTSAAWGAGGAANVANGSLTVSGAYARSANIYPITRLQGRLKFSGTNSAFQHFGFSEDLNTSWLLFSIPGYDPTHIYARTNIAGVFAETQLNVSLDVYHDFLLVVGGGTAKYYVDGALLATHNVNPTGSTYVWLSSGNNATPLAADSIIVGTYPASATFLSAPLDAGHSVTWGAFYWRTSGVQTATIQARTSVDGVNWTAWSSATSTTGTVNLSLTAGRYVQYQLNLSTADPTQSPEVQAVAATYTG